MTRLNTSINAASPPTISKIIWKIGPVAVNNFVYLEPFVTMLAAWWLLDEQLTPIAVTGGLIILAGVFISTQAVHKRPLSR